MSLPHLLRESDQPWRYDLGYDKLSNALTITVPRSAHENIFILPHLINVRIPRFAEAMQITAPFVDHKKGQWGYGAPITTTITNEAVTYTLPLPKIREGGWPKMYEVCASLYFLFEQLNFLEIELGSQKKQLMAIETNVSHQDTGGNGIAATVSHQLIAWLSLQPTGRDTELSETMRQARCSIEGQDQDPEWCNKWGKGEVFIRFTASPKVHLGTHDQARHLDPEHHYIEGEAYLLIPHNMDNPIHQLCMLVGLALINDAARASGY